MGRRPGVGGRGSLRFGLGGIGNRLTFRLKCRDIKLSMGMLRVANCRNSYHTEWSPKADRRSVRRTHGKVVSI